MSSVPSFLKYSDKIRHITNKQILMCLPQWINTSTEPELRTINMY